MNITEDYKQGQMMGMLYMIRMLKNRSPIPATVIDTIESEAIKTLSAYFDKPEEDVYLMVDKEINKL